jgi:hypothetical protein
MGIFLGDRPVSVFFNGASASLPVQGVFLGGIQVFPAAAAATDTALLLNFNGTNGSTTFTDSSPNEFAVTANGDAKISTAQSKFGGASGLFNDEDAYLSLAYTPDLMFSGSNATFTVEAWLRPESTQTGSEAGGGNAGAILSTRLSAVFSPYEFLIRTDLTISVLIRESSNQWVSVPNSDTALAANEWNHIAFVCDGGLLTLYVNGVEDEEISEIPVTFYENEAEPTFYIGAGGDGFFNGYIDDFRVLKGRALYTANFTPPAAQLGVV